MLFPKPEKKTKEQRRKERRERMREIDPKYIEWVHGWGCCICGKYPVHAHHVNRKSQLGSDRSCIPLCQDHHVGVSGIHPIGVLTFEKRYGITMEDVVADYNEKYDAGKIGPMHRDK